MVLRILRWVFALLLHLLYPSILSPSFLSDLLVSSFKFVGLIISLFSTSLLYTNPLVSMRHGHKHALTDPSDEGKGKQPRMDLAPGES